MEGHIVDCQWHRGQYQLLRYPQLQSPSHYSYMGKDNMDYILCPIINFYRMYPQLMADELFGLHLRSNCHLYHLRKWNPCQLLHYLPVIATHLNPQLKRADANPLSIIAGADCISQLQNSWEDPDKSTPAADKDVMLWCSCYLFMLSGGSGYEMNTSAWSFEEGV